MLELTEQVTTQKLPGNFRAYEIDGHVAWAAPEFAEHIRQVHERVQDFVDSCPLMENLSDNQDYVMSFCQDTGFSKPCYGEWCAGCDTDSPECSSPDEDWKDA